LLIVNKVTIEYQKELLKLVDVDSVLEDEILLSVISENLGDNMSLTDNI